MNIVEFYENSDIEHDFDEIFYVSQYPETADFYQPFCLENNINNRKRLYYHYKFYGSKNFKNLEEKNKLFFFSIKDHRQIKSNKLAVITSFFNPCNYNNIKNNYKIFSHHVKKYADLFPIELSLNNDFFINDSNSIRIKGDSSNILWQKEALLNILLEEIPTEYTDVAWIDCDILFNDKLWVSKLLNLSNEYKICQLFSHGFRLGPKNEKNEFSSLVRDYPHGTSGFAWAGRREILNEIKFLDNQILGGADFIMASAFLNKPQMIDNLGTNYINDNNTQKWIDKATSIVGNSVCYLDVSITHLYHGSIDNRNYTNRYQIIKNYELDVSKDKIWKINNKNLQEAALHYFENRKEDDNIL